jgi:cytochrome c oxidase subunit IV
MPEPVVSARTYLITYAALLGLTLATTLIALLNLGGAEMLVALLLAFGKAAIIASIFMHALYEGRLVRLVIAGAGVWLLIMLSLTLNDYITRGWLGFGGK